MTPWERVNKELLLQKKDWKWLAEQLGFYQIQRVDHWRKRGIPPKWYVEIEKALKKPPRWVIGEVVPSAHPEGYTEAALDVALMFDTIPVSERLLRAQAFYEIRDVIERLKPSEPPKDSDHPRS